MIKLSASSIKTFIKCSKMFYYYKNFPEENIDTPEGAVGKVVHKILEDHWDGSDYNEDLKSYIKEYNFDKLLVDRLQNCLVTFTYADEFCPELHNLKQTFKEHDLREYWFDEKISNDVSLVGRVDHIVKDSDILIDWKTGQTKRSISNDIQYIIYFTMYKKIFGRYPTVYQVDLAKGFVDSFQPNATYISTLYDAIIPKIVSNIKSNTYYKEGYFNGSCYRCSFIGICSRDT